MADTLRALGRTAGELLVTAGLVLLLFCVYELQVTGLYTGRQQAALGEQLEREWAQERPVVPVRTQPRGAAPAGGAATAEPVRAAPTGSAFAVLRAPRLGRDWRQVVVEGVGVEDLRKGVGHFPGTALPGQVGNVVFSGHRTTYGSPFGGLGELRPGDAFVVETRDSWFTYRVTGTRIVQPTQVEVTYPVPGRRGAVPRERLLTLTTCHPKFSARQRMVVQARLQGVGSKAGGVLPSALTEGV